MRLYHLQLVILVQQLVLRLPMNKLIFLKYILALMVCGIVFSAYAATIDTQFKAHIVDNSCRISVSNGGNISLGIVSLNYLQSLSPTQYSGGSAFTITVDQCGEATSRTGSQLHLSFRPESKNFYTSTRQVFWNDVSVEESGAQNVGVVIFADQTVMNVLNTNGDSDVVFNVDNSAYKNTYSFTARMQKADANFNVGLVTSNVIVDVYYD